jgi:hypothetical protein
LRPFKVRISANLRHRCQDLGKAPSAGASERGGENFPMFGLCTASMRSGSLLERPHKLFIDTTHQQVSHLTAPKV